MTTIERTPIRNLVAKLGGIVPAARLLGVSKTLIGKCRADGEVYSLELALAMAREACPDDTTAQLAWVETVSPARLASRDSK